jgi:lariat debranching enzyme
MDKLSIISGALFFAADVFAIASLAMPFWIVSNIGGTFHFIRDIFIVV